VPTAVIIIISLIIGKTKKATESIILICQLMASIYGLFVCCAANIAVSSLLSSVRVQSPNVTRYSPQGKMQQLLLMRGLCSVAAINEISILHLVERD
jgi:hypothetical protein